MTVSGPYQELSTSLAASYLLSGRWADNYFEVIIYTFQERGNRDLRTYPILLAVFLCSAESLWSGAHPHRDSASGPSDAMAHILLTASDKAGSSVAAPVRESVQLHIGGQPVEIEEIRSLKDSPLFFSVLVDISGSSKKFADQQIAATTKLFGELSSGDNHGYLILFKSELATDDHFITATAVENILKRFPAQSRSGGTALYDGLIHAAMSQLASTKIPVESRRAIFVLSDGGDNSSHKSLNETLKVLQEEGIPVFSIGFSRSNGSDSSREMKRDLDTLKTLNDATGGWGTFLDERGDVVGRAAGLTSGQCLVLFKAPSLKPKKSYPIRIESSAKDIHIMAPKEYFVP